MKHKWKPETDYPENWPGRQQCTVCDASFCAPYDYLDTDRVVKYVLKQKARNDCPGKKG